MTSFSVPVDAMVPISRFSRGGAGAAFAQVSDGHPVTVLRNNQPAYFIFNGHDVQHFMDLEEENRRLRNAEARRQALGHDGVMEFGGLDELKAHYGD